MIFLSNIQNQVNRNLSCSIWKWVWIVLRYADGVVTWAELHHYTESINSVLIIDWDDAYGTMNHCSHKMNNCQHCRTTLNRITALNVLQCIDVQKWIRSVLARTSTSMCVLYYIVLCALPQSMLFTQIIIHTNSLNLVVLFFDLLFPILLSYISDKVSKVSRRRLNSILFWFLWVMSFFLDNRHISLYIAMKFIYEMPICDND